MLAARPTPRRRWAIVLPLIVAVAACNGQHAPPGALRAGGQGTPAAEGAEGVGSAARGTRGERATAGTATAGAATAGAAGAAGAATAHAAVENTAATRAFVVAAIGDSLTDARSGGGRYLDHLRQHCPRSRFDNFGVGGDMVSQMRRRLLRDVWAPGHPEYTHLIVFGGVNDLYSDLTAGRRPANIRVDLAWMYEEARRRGARVVAMTVAPWGGFKRYFNPTRQASTLELNRWIAAQLPAKAVDHVVDAYSLLSCGEPERLCAELAQPFEDGLHFGPRGHQMLGQALLEQVFAGCV